MDGVLPSIVILLAVAVFVVIVFKKLRLSPVLGYFVAGGIIGEYGLKIVTYDQIHHIGEYGVIFLLYAIGLELSFERLKAMRQYVFGLGGMQVILTGIMIAGAVSLLDDNGSRAAVLIGGGLALSSTAVVLQVLDDNKTSSTQMGRISFAILLLQDFAVVPLLVIAPKLGSASLASLPYEIFISIVKAAAVLLFIFVVGRMFFRPLFRLISSDQESSNNELFIAVTLLVALAAAFGTESAGLSDALGAFTAGILVAETEYQRKAEESIYPFKGLLLGLFFMSVGMEINIMDVYHNIGAILTYTGALILLKAGIITALCILFRFSTAVAIHSGLMLAQGGEFAFILFKMGIENKVIEDSMGELLLLVVTCSMALTPVLSIIGTKIEAMLTKDTEASPNDIIERGARDLNNHVIIAGFGKVGKMIARILESESINYIVIDINSENVKEEEVNGFPIFKGNISMESTLIAAGAERASSVILTMSNSITKKKALKVMNSKFPELFTIVRSQDLSNSTELYELGATVIIPEEYELGLQLGGALLKAIGKNELEITRIKERFRAGNYESVKQYEDIVDEF
jgi:monovalent cation:H+ antiporter-2, CPA2 family